MRILACRPGPSFSVADVHRGWVGALRSLVDLADFNLDDRLAFYEMALEGHEDDIDGTVSERTAIMASRSLNADIYAFQPDVLLLTFGKFVAPFVYQLARAHGVKVVLHATESPYEDELQLQIARDCDLVLLNDPTNLDKFREVTRAEYMPHAYDPTVHHPGPVAKNFRSDFCFVGSGFPSRQRFFQQVDFNGIDVALAGHWPWLQPDDPLLKFLAHDISRCCDNAEAADLYRGARVSANLYRNEGETTDAGWAAGPREIELAACGTFFLRDPRPESDQLFPMLPTFDGPADFGEKLRWYLAHPSERIDAAHKASGAIAARTFANNAKRLLELIDSL